MQRVPDPGTPRGLLRLVLLLALVTTPALVPAQDPRQLLEQSLSLQLQADDRSRAAQVKVAKLADETSELTAEYRDTVQQLERVRLYNQNLEDLVRDQEAEQDDINRQLRDFEGVEQGIVPLMIEMIGDLERFVAADLPFNLEERRLRVERLRDNLDESDLAISEKYRQVMNAYLVEAAYGREIEASSGTLELDGAPREVDFFRVGRILLAYQTRDQSETGFYNKQSGAWEVLDDRYRPFVAQGLKIARKQSVPDLLRLPVSAPELAQ